MPEVRRRTNPRAHSNRRSAARWLAVGLLGSHVVLAPQLLGGTLPWAMTLTALSAVVCLAAAAYACDALDSRVPALLWVSLSLLGWTALQALPMPCDFVAQWAPASAENLRGAYEALGQPAPRNCALSLDPGSTQQEIVKGSAIVATMLAAWLLALRRGRREIFWAVAISSLAMSLVALAHGVLELDLVFGVYKPLNLGRGLLLAPLMNMNNLGGFAALGVPLWIGLTHRHEAKEVRWIGRIAAAITLAAALLSMSRGAILQVCVGLFAMLACMYLAARRNRKLKPKNRFQRSRYGLAAALVAGLAFVAYVGGEQVTQQFQDRDIGKLDLAARAFGLALEHPWFGVGRGAFSSAFVGVEGQSLRFVYAENFIAQWASEWGLPFTLLWLGSVAIALFRALRGTSSLARIGAAIALLSYCVQNLVDLGFELVGVSVVAAALLGASIVPDGPRVLATRPLARAQTLVAAVLAGAVVAVALLGPRLPDQALTVLDGRLRAAFAQRDRAKFRTTLARAVALHPTEPVFAVIAATEALVHGDDAAPRWLNRAMQLAPLWGAPHVLTYQMLWQGGLRSQALLELRKAAEGDLEGRLTAAHVCRLANQRAEYVLEAAPTGRFRRAYLERAVNCVGHDHRSSEPIEGALLAEFPESPLAYERRAFRLAVQGNVDESLDLFARLLARHPQDDSARVSRAEILLRSGRLEETVATVDVDLPRVREQARSALLRRQAFAYARLGDSGGIERAIQAYRRLTGNTPDGLADSYALEGYVQLELRHTGTAFAAFREAYGINQDTKHLKAVAQLAHQLGDRPQELWAYMKLCEREPLDPSNCAKRDQLLRPAPAPQLRR